MEASHETHRPHIKVGKDEDKKKCPPSPRQNISYFVFSIFFVLAIASPVHFCPRGPHLDVS